MYEVPDPSVPAGSIVQVMQPGYMIGERVLRPALVAVAKGAVQKPRRFQHLATTTARSRRQGFLRRGVGGAKGPSIHVQEAGGRITPRIYFARGYLGWMPSRTWRAWRVSAVVQAPAFAMPIICMKPPVPKRSHCATKDVVAGLHILGLRRGLKARLAADAQRPGHRDLDVLMPTIWPNVMRANWAWSSFSGGRAAVKGAATNMRASEIVRRPTVRRDRPTLRRGRE